MINTIMMCISKLTPSNNIPYTFQIVIEPFSILKRDVLQVELVKRVFLESSRQSVPSLQSNQADSDTRMRNIILQDTYSWNKHPR